jgi:hypothetical protein
LQRGRGARQHRHGERDGCKQRGKETIPAVMGICVDGLGLIDHAMSINEIHETNRQRVS